MKKQKQQKGVILVTGLIFLLIAMLATVSTLENAGILAYEQGNNIQKYRLFYQLESTLETLERPFLDNDFYANSLDDTIRLYNIKNISTQPKTEFLDDIWNQNNTYVQSTNDCLFLIEYLGVKPIGLTEEYNTEESLSVWLFRISISSLNDYGYWLQSIIEVYPIETAEILNRQEVSKSKQQYTSQRIAWYERIANE